MNTTGILGMLVWCGLWIAIAVHCEKEPTPQALGTLLVAFAGSTCALVFVVLPWIGIDISHIARWAHHAAFTSLGLFLIAAEFLRASARRHAITAWRLAASRHRQWWWLTELIPGATALTLMLSGLRLIYENPATCSLRESWLFWLVAAFSFFFADGLCFYRPAVRTLTAEISDEPALSTFPKNNRLRLPAELQLTLHAISFPFVFALAHSHLALPHPLRPVVESVEQRLAFLPSGWPQVLTASALIAIVSGIIWALRTAKT